MSYIALDILDERNDLHDIYHKITGMYLLISLLLSAIVTASKM